MTTSKKVAAVKDRVLELRQKGLSKENIALELEVDKSVVYAALEGQDPKPEKVLRRQQILDLYDTGATYEEIAKEMKVSTGHVKSMVSLYSKTFQPVGKLNYRPATTMTLGEMHTRRRMMNALLEANGVSAYAYVMRDDLYRIEPNNAESIRKILEMFPKQDILEVTKYRVVVRKVFAAHTQTGDPMTGVQTEAGL